MLYHAEARRTGSYLTARQAVIAHFGLPAEKVDRILAGDWGQSFAVGDRVTTVSPELALEAAEGTVVAVEDGALFEIAGPGYAVQLDGAPDQWVFAEHELRPAGGMG
jgi:hypothetical protein